jgi:hypothetical protein
MSRLLKICVFSAVMIAGSIFAAPKAEAHGYGFYGHSYYRPYYYNYYRPIYTPIYVYPTYNYGYFGGYGY